MGHAHVRHQRPQRRHRVGTQGRVLDLTQDPNSGDAYGRKGTVRTRQRNQCRSTDRGAHRGRRDGAS